LQKLSNLFVIFCTIFTISACGIRRFNNNLPNGLMVASDICAQQKHNECHYDYENEDEQYLDQQTYEQTTENTVQTEQKPETEQIKLKELSNTVKIKENKQDVSSKSNTEQIKVIENKKIDKKKNQSPTIKERYKISVEINDISTERAIDKINNAEKYNKYQNDSIKNTSKIEQRQEASSPVKKIDIYQSEKFKTKEKKQINAMNPEIEKQNQENNKSNINTAHTEIIENKKVDKEFTDAVKQAKSKSDFFLEEVRFSDLPNFKLDDMGPAFNEFLKSCSQYLKDDSKWIKSDQIAIDRKHMSEICADANLIKSDLNKYQTTEHNKVMEGFFMRWFSPYKVYSKGKDTGTFTGYYESHIKGSVKATCDYLYPIYGLPDNPEDQKLTREQINNGALRGKAKILFWAKNPVDIYLTQIQGSGVVETENGKQYRIGYAGNNGYQFVGTGATIKKMGLHPEKGLSMISIRDYLIKNPEIAKKVMNNNKRFIFFKENKQNGAVGTFGTTLTPKRTIAVDQTYIPLGLPVYIDVKDPNDKPLNRMVIASDTGAAIKGGIRADFFFGFGETAFKQAGRMKQSGKYFIMLPKNQDKFMVKSDNIHCLD